jgi:hypothetical protein
MAFLQDHAAEIRRRVPIERIPRVPPEHLRATWRQADPERIDAALRASQTHTAGGWYVATPSTRVPRGRSATRVIAGREVVLWRGPDGELYAGPGACPHLGALLDDCPVTGRTLRCRWHGLALGPRGAEGWQPYAAYDDGLLAWVQLPGAEAPTARPAAPDVRPPAQRSIAAVVSMTGRCEPVDVIANRLDPWHGSWFHPYAFSHLEVDDTASTTERLVVDVTFRLGRTWGVPVRAEFFCPDARTIVMRILDGEGAGSVVETHATPTGVDDRGGPLTEVVEATIAFSDRPGFAGARRVAALLRLGMRHTARRLWRDDLAYAERRYALRAGG